MDAAGELAELKLWEIQDCWVLALCVAAGVAWRLLQGPRKEGRA
ncbi:hypothetical protein [Kitasatospora sp. MMS16-BH015]|nr:hypothetical protein [Kitasatospora sp. MMS16-BH015]